MNKAHGVRWSKDRGRLAFSGPRMRGRVITLIGAALLTATGHAQYGIGIHGGPLFFQGLSEEAAAALSSTSGYTVGLQFVEGAQRASGFRFGLELCRRNYALLAQNVNRWEELIVESDLINFSAEMRWPMGRRSRFYFELGPVIGFEVHERRQGATFTKDVFTDRGDEQAMDEVERGFAIRDGHWRIGFTGELPVGSGWYVTGGVHACPGIGNWARGNNFATFDTNVRAGLMRRFTGGRR